MPVPGMMAIVAAEFCHRCTECPLPVCWRRTAMREVRRVLGIAPLSRAGLRRKRRERAQRWQQRAKQLVGRLSMS